MAIRPASLATMRAMPENKSPPFCGTQLAEICGVDEWSVAEGGSGAPRLFRASTTPPRRRGAPGGIDSLGRTVPPREGEARPLGRAALHYLLQLKV